MATGSAREWVRRLQPYRLPSDGRSAFETVLTFGLLVSVWALMWFALSYSILLTLALADPGSLSHGAPVHHPA
jgi:omega-6 fatty acid desaturase (delta-12 desaturase)